MTQPVVPTLSAQQSLMQRYPRHIFVPLIIAGSTVLLIRGLCLPLIHTQQLVFWKSSYSVWEGVVALWELHEYVLALILFFFSMVFPFIKLVSLWLIWFVRLADEQRATLLHRLGILGKWSMLDVFVVAILIVLVKIGPLAKIEPRAGVYVFASAIAASMLTTMYVERLARRPHHAVPPPAI